MTRLPELTTGLDYYKPTMSQLHYHQHPDTEVTFTFKNRNEQNLTEYVDPAELQARLDDLRYKSWNEEELAFFATLERQDGTPMFAPDYLDYLAENQLPPITVGRDPHTDDLAIQTTGEAPLVTFWETVVMSEVNEMYFENYLVKHGLDPEAVYNEGDRRLSEKIAILQQNPDIKFSDFGTRRHFSFRWQKHVVERLMNECPDNFVGTSNVALARTLQIQPIGTFAHEMPMIYAGIADAKGENIRASHNQFLEDWQTEYNNELSVVLPDTFGTEFFFNDFTLEQAKIWHDIRHDSGDPFNFGDRTIDYYEQMGIDPLDKGIVFSDGLNIKTILQLRDYFKGRINVKFGWGTTLTNDLGLDPLNIVMKATHVRLPETGQEATLVKLSDNEGKHTGPAANIRRYKQIFAAATAREGVVTC